MSEVNKIRCGHCKGYHSSIQMIKNCMILSYTPLSEVGRFSDHNSTRSVDTLSSDGTVTHLSYTVTATEAFPTTAKKAASQKLQEVLSVPVGRYALNEGVNTDDGLAIVKFYKVDRPTEGRWAGYTFVKHLVADGFGLAEYPVKGEWKDEVLAAIALDPAEASMMYGRELGSCGVCNRPLTDAESRAKGIGPICATRRGW